eukprot:TRINITY_DN12192_c0_g1_i1.p1 TRINITY_DN12192_c0_g1~~TRINITY_DN12192_c0_g1_i1.p1  ORF type:complete len:441 (+),score=118.70 TRINITY_DN12192_c0_g1_i1:57-1379(+)
MSQKNDYQDYVIKIRPFQFLHIKDTNTNVVRVVTGPKTLTCLDHEKVCFGPEKMIVVPPRHYVIVDNPVVTKKVVENDETIDVPVADELGQVLLRHGEQEVRFSQQPFPLYDGEKCSKIMPLQIVEENTALRLKAKRDFTDRYAADGDKREKQAGQEWYFKGPGTYYPQVEVEVVNTVRAVILKANQALKVRAREDCNDYKHERRKAGEEWLVKIEGAYLPGVNEEVVETLQAYILTDKNALHVRAKATFTDSNEIERKAGSEWLVTSKDIEAYIPDVYEEVTRQVALTVLENHHYCIIADPVGENGKSQLGVKKLVRGETSFFLKPGEKIIGNIQRTIILAPDDALWLSATESFTDTHGGGNVRRQAGDTWLCAGPGEFCPPIEVKIQQQIKSFMKVEFFNIYLFQPGTFFGALFGFIFLLYIFMKLFGSSSSEAKTDL